MPIISFFFFQAEDGIRDHCVTGVQTCALPIYERLKRICVFDLVANNADRKAGHCLLAPDGAIYAVDNGLCFHVEPKLRTVIRSEERRVGKECRCRGAPYEYRKKRNVGCRTEGR